MGRPLGDLPCGDHRKYRRGCHCDACRKAATEERNRYPRAKGDLLPRGHRTSWTDAHEASCHVLALLTSECGTMRNISQAAGVDIETIEMLAAGERTQVWKSTARAILSVDEAFLRRKAAYVPSRLAIQRVRSLQANGWPLRDLAKMLGYSDGVVGLPFVYKQQDLIKQATDRKVEALYNRLGDTPGPSLQARKRAAALGWKTPIHYTDEGFPFHDLPRNDGREFTERSARQKIEMLLITVRDGDVASEIAGRLGVAVKTVDRARTEVGLRTEYIHEDTVRVREDCLPMVPHIYEAWSRIEVMEDAVEVWSWLVETCRAVTGSTQGEEAA